MPGGGIGPLGGGIVGGPLMPPGGLGPLGGMHVGPGHPYFSDRMRHPDLGPGGFGGAHPGGVRWDPISECAVCIVCVLCVLCVATRSRGLAALGARTWAARAGTPSRRVKLLLCCMKSGLAATVNSSIFAVIDSSIFAVID